MGAAPPCCLMTLPATLLQHTAGSPKAMHCTTVRSRDAADGVSQLATLSRLTHLDLGRSDGIAALAPRLPALQSLALDLTYCSASAVLLAA